MDQAPKDDTAVPGTDHRELIVPLYARLGKTECQVGRLTIPDGQVDLEPERLRLACQVLAAVAQGKATGG
jgi:hypothetical protein